MNTETYTTPAPAYFAVPRPRVSNWAAPLQGTGVSHAATQLGVIAGVSNATCMTQANAANRATRKDATGGEAFEDPV